MRTSSTSKAGGPVALGEEEQVEAKEQTHKILARSGSTGGSKSLFVNSAGLSKTNSIKNLGLAGSESGFLKQEDPSITFDYKTLKKSQYDNRKNENRSLGLSQSISMQRLEREFSPEKNIAGNLVLDIGSAEFDSQAEIKDTKKKEEKPLAK